MKNLRKIPIILLLIAVLSTLQSGRIQANFDGANSASVNGCHFAIAVPFGLAGYDLSVIGVGHYLDWGNRRDSSVAANIDYYPVVNVSDAGYEGALRSLKSKLESSTLRGATWIIGNEPDSQVIYQDHVSAETYGERFFEMATLIRKKDPSAKIAFGTVIQPSPVRLYYLEKAINRLVEKTHGNRAAALALIDIYSIHAFILNEEPLYDRNGKGISWGAGVPIGYDAENGWPAYQVINGDQTHDINIFKERIVAFRQWMKKIGPLEQTKALYITEYGSLFPTFLNVSELTTAIFMEQGFDFMLGTKDPSLGQAADDYRLVQKWFWYSLNDQLTHFGGSLYDPSNRKLTTVGEHFISYDPSTAAVPPVNSDVYVLSDDPIIDPSPLGSNYYRIKIGIGNLISSDRLTEVRVDLYLADNLVGSGTVKLPRCAGTARASVDVNNLIPGQDYKFTARVSVIGGNGPDINPANNQFTLSRSRMPTFLKVNLPFIHK